MKFVLIGTHRPEWIARGEERGAKAYAMIEKLKMKVECSYYTQGQFDFVTIVEAPDAETASMFSLWYAQQGFGSVQTMRAFSGAEMSALVSKMELNAGPSA
jgi:uncharacterized protein with GYD domain